MSGSLGLGPGKSKLKDKLSAIRQDRAERRESLQKQDAIHEVDSSEDETDEGSEDSQDGRRVATFTTPPLMRPTTVRTGPGGTLPSLCLSPSTPHATFSHTGSSQVSRVTPSGSGSAFISVKKDTFLKPTPPLQPKDLKPKVALPEPKTNEPTAAPGFNTTDTQEPPNQTTDTTEPPRASCSSPGIPKEKKEADNRRLCAAAAAASQSSTSSTPPAPPAPPTDCSVDNVVSQLATVAKSVLGPVRLGSKDQKASREAPPTDAPPAAAPPLPHLSLSRQNTSSQRDSSGSGGATSTPPASDPQHQSSAPPPTTAATVGSGEARAADRKS